MAAPRTNVHYADIDRERRKLEKVKRPEERTAFERDRSRIIHSAAFRRLQGKTQIFTAGESDFFRTRLTHSLEVAQIGKGIALRLKADTDLVEAISLAHDIGHPPFGHAGEVELKRLMLKYGGFEANAQNVRILTRLEHKSSEYGGLNLTRAVIDGQLKYKNAFDVSARKFRYEDDEEIIEWANIGAPPGSQPKSFECQIMDWADDIAFAIHDLEDGLHSGFINIAVLNNQPLISRVVDKAHKSLSRDLSGSKLKSRDVGNVWSELLLEIVRIDPDLGVLGTTGLSNPIQRKYRRKELTSFLIGRYIKSTERTSRASTTGAHLTERYLYELRTPVEQRIQVSLLKQLVWEAVISSPQIMTLEEKGKFIIRSLFLKFLRGNNVERLLPDDWQQVITEELSNADSDIQSQNRAKARVVCDYISGMTDGYVQKTYERLFLPNHGSVYEVL